MVYHLLICQHSPHNSGLESQRERYHLLKDSFYYASIQGYFRTRLPSWLSNGAKRIAAGLCAWNGDFKMATAAAGINSQYMNIEREMIMSLRKALGRISDLDPLSWQDGQTEVKDTELVWSVPRVELISVPYVVGLRTRTLVYCTYALA